MPRFRSFLALATSVFALAATSTADSMHVGGVQHMQPLGTERVPLELDGERLAIFIDGMSDAGAAAVLVEDLGLEPTDMVVSSVPGWFYLDVSESAFFGDRLLVDCIDDMLRLDRFDMVSPVYRAGTHRLPWVPTRDVIIAIDPAIEHATLGATTRS